MNPLETLMRINIPAGNNIIGITVFICMNIIGAWKVFKRVNGPWYERFFAIGAGMVSAHFFIQCADMMSIPSQIIRVGIPHLVGMGGYFTLSFMQMFGAEMIVMYTYRNYFNFKNFGLILFSCLVFALGAQFFWGTTSIQSFTMESRLPYYLYSYIPVWVFCYISYSKLFLGV